MNLVMRPDFLFAMPSWVSGVARTLDLGAQFDSYNESPTGKIADAEALFSDWRIVGETLASAMREFANGQIASSKQQTEEFVRR